MFWRAMSRGGSEKRPSSWVFQLSTRLILSVWLRLGGPLSVVSYPLKVGRLALRSLCVESQAVPETTTDAEAKIPAPASVCFFRDSVSLSSGGHRTSWDRGHCRHRR